MVLCVFSSFQKSFSYFPSPMMLTNINWLIIVFSYRTTKVCRLFLIMMQMYWDINTYQGIFFNLASMPQPHFKMIYEIYFFNKICMALFVPVWSEMLWYEATYDTFYFFSFNSLGTASMCICVLTEENTLEPMVSCHFHFLLHQFTAKSEAQYMDPKLEPF